ncbi:MAG: hypothetical protein QXW10_01720 [Candidatus Micrarchaeaceae archaeon]
MKFIKSNEDKTYAAFSIDAKPNIGPSGMDFIRSVGKHAFAILYDLHDGSTYLLIGDDGEAVPKFLVNSMPGLELSPAKIPQVGHSKAYVLSVYKAPAVAYDLIKQIMGLYYGRDSAVMFLYEPISEEKVNAFKSEIESILSNRVVRSTSSVFNGSLGSRANMSSQTEVYENSEENMLLKALLEDIDNSILSGDGVYKAMVSVLNDTDGELYRFITDRSVVLSRTDCKTAGIEAAFKCMHETDSMLMGIGHASAFLGFYGNTKVNYALTTIPSYTEGNIPIGTYLRDGVSDTHMEIKIAESVLNLGMVITGLPGSGKTSAAMSILDSICRLQTHGVRPKIIILSSTSEWDNFAVLHGLHLIRLYKDDIPINFFSYGEGAKGVQFYEDLSVLLANAAKAGPYRNPMEKCFLNAFRRSYKDTNSPSPTEVYDAVEESIIKLHGKRTNTGVKYTKHGENIKSALENLRSILSREEFSAPHWINLGKVIEEGAVFDMSSVSNSSKPYMYSLVLNQVYSMANGFDENGDDSLRMVICVEESQILFDSSPKDDNAATEDLSRRIQDFRKRGIALVLITHNAIDIPPQIRRICQNKIYMKQASDTAIIAARDLVFSNADPDMVVLKLKHMNSRTAAIDYVVKRGSEKTSGDSVFIRTIDYEPAKLAAGVLDSYEAGKLDFTKAPKGPVAIALVQHNGNRDKEIKNGELIFAQVESLGEIMEETQIIDNKCIFHAMTYGKRYRLNLLNSRGKVLVSCDIRADSEVSVSV